MPRTRIRNVEPIVHGGGQEDVDALEGHVQAKDAATEPDYIERNRAAWEHWAPGHLAAGRKAWEEVDIRLGIWDMPESELRLLAGIEPGHDVIELGCGTAEVSAWLARRGVRPVGIDISTRQIRNAESLQSEFRVSFPLVCANAERVQYEDASFDVAISEYGASLWCDPRRWLPEASRLLRPGGQLIFFTNSALLMVCTPDDGGPAGERLLRDFFSHSRLEFEVGGAVEFHSTHGSWIRLLRTNGFMLENLIEVRPPPDAKARHSFVTLEWAQHWPSEEIWIARKTS